jgi:hypothetical protein
MSLMHRNFDRPSAYSHWWCRAIYRYLKKELAVGLVFELWTMSGLSQTMFRCPGQCPRGALGWKLFRLG